jgi:peroxiredoxin Q/BCP
MYGRTYMGTARITFVISETGVIEDIIQKVDTKNHTNQILGNDKPSPIAGAKKTMANKKAKPALQSVSIKTALKKK